MPYLTPSTIPTARISRRLRIPNDPLIVAAVNGAIAELIHAYNWQLFGAVTPADIAVAMRDMYLDYEDSTGMSFVGMVFPYVSITPPTNCLLCDNTLYLKSDYPELAAVLAGTSLDIDATHFRVPNHNGRVPRGFQVQAGIGAVGGADTVTLTGTNLPAHQHTEITAVPAVGAALVGVPIPSAVPGVGVTGSAGAGGSFSIRNLNVALAMMIVAK